MHCHKLPYCVFKGEKNMGISRPAIKQNAKLLITTTKPSPILVGLVYLAITFILRFLSYAVSGDLKSYMDTMNLYYAGKVNLDQIISGEYVPALPVVGAWGKLLGFAIFLMLVMMSIGFTIYCLHICQFRKAGFGNLFDGFAIFLKAIWLEFIMIFFIFLWSLLLIVPGIIAAYRYRMAFFIMIENPHMGALDCILASKQMMTGHKGELFVLDLSFLGWAILTIVPFVIIWVVPYYNITVTNYYIALRDLPKPIFDAQN